MTPGLLVLAVMVATPQLAAGDSIAEEHTIIVVDQSAKGAQPPSPLSSQPYQTPIERIWRHPDQVFVDSDYGPLPLFAELGSAGEVYIPPGLVREYAADPTPAKAALYLEQRRVAARRYLQMSQVLQEVAAVRGDVVPKDFTPPGSAMANARQLVRPANATEDSIGVPALGPQQAMVSGLKKEEVPVIPGRTTARYVEVIYIWDHRCPYSVDGFRDFARVGREVFERQLGPRFLTVSMDNDAMTVQAQLDWFDWRWQQDRDQVSTRFIENTVDMTNLRKALKITRTPTYFFVDRRTGKMQRLEGRQGADSIRHSLMALVHHGDEEWSAADPRWFRPVRPAPDADGGGSVGDDPGSIPDASPLLPPRRAIQAWDPSNVSD